MKFLDFVVITTKPRLASQRVRSRGTKLYQRIASLCHKKTGATSLAIPLSSGLSTSCLHLGGIDASACSLFLITFLFTLLCHSV